MTRLSLLLAALAAGLALAGCAGTAEREPASISKRETLDRSARLAFAQEQYGQAATLYAAVLQAALAEDEAARIIDARFNLALCQTYVGEYDAALAQTEWAEAERRRRGLPVDPQLQLLAGTIHYRAGRLERAQDTLAALLQASAASPTTRARAHFVAGLIAADRAALPALRDHLAAVQAGPAAASRADSLELQARLLALEGNIDDALRRLDQTADLRRAERDHRGMTRALATAGGLAEHAGRPQAAADYLYRAGRSAAQRDDPQARDWLRRAIDAAALSGDAALAREAEAALPRTDASP